MLRLTYDSQRKALFEIKVSIKLIVSQSLKDQLDSLIMLEFTFNGSIHAPVTLLAHQKTFQNNTSINECDLTRGHPLEREGHEFVNLFSHFVFSYPHQYHFQLSSSISFLTNPVGGFETRDLIFQDQQITLRSNLKLSRLVLKSIYLVSFFCMNSTT